MNITRSMGLGGLASGASVVTALVSSACCWLPLLLIAFGASAAGFAVALEAYRPYLLIASGLLLAFGFYLNYFRKERCEDGECRTPNTRARRFNRIVLWTATVMMLAIALFPQYVNGLFGADSSAFATAENSNVGLRVDGMTCEGCAVNVEMSLKNVPGVLDVIVSFENSQAAIVVDPANPPPLNALVDAIEAIGYEASALPNDG